MGIWTKWARINGKYYQMTDDNIVRDGVRGVDRIVECKQQHLTIVKIDSLCGVIDSDGKFIIHLSNYYCIWPFDNFFIAEHKCNPNTTEYHIYECDIYDIHGNLLIRNIDEIYSINQCGAILHNNKYDFNLLLTVIGDEAYLQIPERADLGRYERGDSMEAYKEYAFPYKITDFQKDVVIFDYKNVFSRALFLRCGEQSRCYGCFAIIDSETAFCSNGLHLGLVSSKGYNVDCKYIAISKPLNGFVYAITEYGDRYLYGELLKWKLSNGQVIPDKSIELFNMLSNYRMLPENKNYFYFNVLKGAIYGDTRYIGIDCDFSKTVKVHNDSFRELDHNWYQEKKIAIFSGNNPYFQILYNENDFGKAIFKDENADTNIVSGATVFTKDDMYEYRECLGKCKDEYGDDYVSDSYDNYTGPSCDDSYMDALDGEPDAYWNID